MVAETTPGGMQLPPMDYNRIVEVNDVVIHANDTTYYVTIWAEITRKGTVEFVGDWAQVTELAEFEVRAVEDEEQLDPERRNITGHFAARDLWALVRSHVWHRLDQLADLCKETLDDNEAYRYLNDEPNYDLNDDTMQRTLYFQGLSGALS